MLAIPNPPYSFIKFISSSKLRPPKPKTGAFEVKHKVRKLFQPIPFFPLVSFTGDIIIRSKSPLLHKLISLLLWHEPKKSTSLLILQKSLFIIFSDVN